MDRSVRLWSMFALGEIGELTPDVSRCVGQGSRSDDVDLREQAEKSMKSIAERARTSRSK